MENGGDYKPSYSKTPLILAPAGGQVFFRPAGLKSLKSASS